MFVGQSPSLWRQIGAHNQQRVPTAFLTNRYLILLPRSLKRLESRNGRSGQVLMASHLVILALCAQIGFAAPSSDALSKSYDYVILGGGLAGLTLANRLTEDHDKQVLVLEAGEAHLNDPLIDIPGFLGSTVGNASYDWLFSTLPQAHANDNTYVWNRGKLLGGSTGINFMAFTRPAENEIDGKYYYIRSRTSQIRVLTGICSHRGSRKSRMDGRKSFQIHEKGRNVSARTWTLRCGLH